MASMVLSGYSTPASSADCFIFRSGLALLTSQALISYPKYSMDE